MALKSFRGVGILAPMKLLLAPLALLMLHPALAESPASWVKTDQTDAFSGAKYSQFILDGHFLTPPQAAPSAPPRLVVKCQEGGEHRAGYGTYTQGSRLTSYLVVGAVLDRSRSRVPVMYRLDDGKAHDAFWSIGTDGTAAFFTDVELSTLIYGHWMPHKENSTPPVHKVVIAMDEAFSGRIIVQFDMPDPAEISDACGLVVHKR